MALSRLTSFSIDDTILRLDYADGRQWIVPLGGIIATLIDPTEGRLVANIFEKGLVGETLEATEGDLQNLGSDVEQFVNAINNVVTSYNFWTNIYNEYSERAAADGAAAFDRVAYRCGKNRFIEILPLAVEGYRLAWNTQFRSAADGGNGFSPRELDCTANRIIDILN